MSTKWSQECCDLVNALHAVYCECSGLPIANTLQRVFCWESWLSHGWTEADLRLVVTTLRRKCEKGERWACSSLLFSRLIRDTDRFEELLSEFRAMARTKRTESGKASVLRATGRPTEPPDPGPKSAEQVMRESEALKKLLETRDNL